MKKLLWLLILLFPSFYAEAGNQVGGYISVQWVSGYTYQITVEDYTIGDPQNSGGCGSVYDLDTIRLWFGDGASTLINRNGIGDSVCTCRKVNTYSSIHTFPGPGTYHLGFDVNARAANICNVVNSVNVDMYIYNTLIILPWGSVPLPEITNPPACNYACPSDCYYYNPDVSVPIGDSVAYSMGECLTMGGIAPGYYNPGATINPVTGKLSWCKPPSDCLWNFAILIITYQTTHEIVGTDTIRLMSPIDTEEMEMEVNVQSDCSLGVNKLIANSDGVDVYPNPSHGKFTLVIASEAKQSQANIEVYNVLGKKVYSQFNIQNPTFNIDLSSQPNGVYLYRVVSENGELIGEGKVVIAK